MQASPDCALAGFALCGSALATVVFAAAAQLLTAAMTRFVLGRRLLRGQQLAVRSAVISRASHYEGDLTKARSPSVPL